MTDAGGAVTIPELTLTKPRTAKERRALAATRRAAVRNIAGWPGLTADQVRYLLDVLGLDPREGRP